MRGQGPPPFPLPLYSRPVNPHLSCCCWSGRVSRIIIGKNGRKGNERKRRRRRRKKERKKPRGPCRLSIRLARARTAGNDDDVRAMALPVGFAAKEPVRRTDHVTNKRALHHIGAEMRAASLSLFLFVFGGFSSKNTVIPSSLPLQMLLLPVPHFIYTKQQQQQQQLVVLQSTIGLLLLPVCDINGVDGSLIAIHTATWRNGCALACFTITTTIILVLYLFIFLSGGGE